jgi:hypothetical protein
VRRRGKGGDRIKPLPISIDYNFRSVHKQQSPPYLSEDDIVLLINVKVLF